MKKYIIIMALFIGSFGFSQVIGADMLNMGVKTTAEMNAITVGQGLQKGSFVYNSSTESIHTYDGTNWNDMGGVGSVGADNQQLSFSGTTLTLEDGGTPIDLDDAFATNAQLTSGLNGKDGSETKVTAGNNISITGSGTIGSPYVVGATYTAGDGIDITGSVISADESYLDGVYLPLDGSKEMQGTLKMNNLMIDEVDMLRFQDEDSDSGNWSIRETSASPYVGDLGIGHVGVYRYYLSQTGTPTQPFHVIRKTDLDTAISGVSAGTDDQTADEVTYDNTTSGLTATDVQGAIDELSSGGISDSGQSMSLQTKTDVTETFNNADVVNSGTATDKRKFTTFTGTNEITLDDTITLYNQPFLLFHKSATGSTTLKKGTGTTFIISDEGELAEDGVTFTDYANASVIALSSNEYLITCSTCTAFTEASDLYEGNNAMDIDEVNGVANLGTIPAGLTVTSSTEQAHDGTYSIKAVNSTGGALDFYPNLYNIESGDTVTLTIYTYRSSGGGNVVVRLDDAYGWSADDAVNVPGVSENDAWYIRTVDETATSSTPKLRLTIPANTTVYFDLLQYTK